jgi:hypothetical protein
MHLAKYSGLDFKIPPFAADPRDTAQQLLQLAIHPQKDKFPDFSSWALKTMHGILPKVLVNTASSGMRLLMEINHGEPTSGNVLAPSGPPHQIYGETLIPVPSRKTKLALGLGICIGIGLLLLSGKKD